MAQVWTPVKKVADATQGAFGPGTFGKRAEAFARFFGTPQFPISQTVIVVLWIVFNGVAVAYRWDPYPFILLNLLFSLQAAYAAPLILLSQKRQADRDRVGFEADSHQRAVIAEDSVRHQEEIISATQKVEAAILNQATMLDE